MAYNKDNSFPLLSFPDKHRWIVFLTWGIAAIFGFPLVYGFTNYMAAQTTSFYSFYFDWETQTPFIPEFIWLYMSLNIVILLPLFMCDTQTLRKYCQTNLITLGIAALIFLIFPAQLGFERLLPTDPYLRELFQNIHNIDKPHNLVPSLHITFSALAFFAIFETHQHRRWLTLVIAIWMVGICASVVFTRQHHIIDIIGGLILAFTGIRFFYLRKIIENPQIPH